MTKPRSPGEIARRITDARLALGLSKSELARKADIDPSYVTRVENGEIEEPAPGRLRQIAAALGMSLGVLLDPEPPTDDEDAQLRRLIEKRLGNRASAAFVAAVMDKVRGKDAADFDVALGVLDVLLKDLPPPADR